MMKLATRRLFILIAAVALSVSCSKKKAGDDVALGDTTNDSDISSLPMNFSAQGSDSGAIEGLYSVNFDYDSSTLTSRAKDQLAKNASWMKKNSRVTMQIEGHCDERGSIEYNLSLGERRAKAVKAYLVGLGVDGKKMTVISFGKEKKLTDGDSEEAHAKNRRANFVPLP